MVERATHNRQVTGSNPVGANNIKGARAARIALSAILLIFVAPLTMSGARAQTGEGASGSADTGASPQVPQSSASEKGAPSGMESAPGVTTTTTTKVPSNNPSSATGVLQPADPNIRRNYLPLEQDDFTYSADRETGDPTVSILGISKELYPGKECSGCMAVRLRLSNGSPTPIIMDGDNVKALFGGTSYAAISEPELLKLSGGQFTSSQKKTLAAVAVTTFGFAEPIVQDMMTTSKTDWTKSYGVDEIRRKAELARFGKRILLPGEELDASVFFRMTAEPPLDTITVPVLAYPDGKPTGCLTAKAPANLPVLTTPPQSSKPALRKE